MNIPTLEPVTMSSLEIATLCEKQHKHVIRDIKKIVLDLYAIDIEKDGPDLDHQGISISYDGRGYIDRIDLDRSHTYTLVTGYSVVLRSKIIDRWMELEASSRKPLSPAEFLLQQAQMLLDIEREQAAIQSKQIAQDKKIEEQERRLNQIETAADWFTCVGYARWAKQTSIDVRAAGDLGRRAAKLCKDLGITPSKVPDPRFGEVGSYPKEILDVAWTEGFGARQ